MEGTLLVPPERGAIIGRALWKVSLPVIPLATALLTTAKPRFVVIGSSQRRQQTSIRPSHNTPASRIPGSRNSSSRTLPNSSSETNYISIYKSKVCPFPQSVSVSRGRLPRLTPWAYRMITNPYSSTLLVPLQTAKFRCLHTGNKARYYQLWS